MANKSKKGLTDIILDSIFHLNSNQHACGTKPKCFVLECSGPVFYITKLI